MVGPTSTKNFIPKVKPGVETSEIAISDDFYQNILIGKEKVMATLQSEKFDVFCWLKGYFPADEIVASDIPDVLNFSLMWNLFESRACEKLNDHSPHHFIEKMERFIREFPSMNSLVNEDLDTLCYFQERYLDDGELNGKFRSLRINNTKWERLVESVLKEETIEPSFVLLALLIIIYILRCNFFHGVKPIRELKEQDINFKVANIFLSKILDLHRH
jgi:hypothetical protein